jgi:hypothetical protein
LSSTNITNRPVVVVVVVRRRANGNRQLNFPPIVTLLLTVNLSSRLTVYHHRRETIVPFVLIISTERDLKKAKNLNSKLNSKLKKQKLTLFVLGSLVLI